MTFHLSWAVVLLFLAAVCFALATFGVSVRKVQLVALGLLFWVLVPFLTSAGVL